MSTSNRLVLVPLEESEIDPLTALQIEFFTGSHRLDGVPGVWTLRTDGVLGVRLELEPDVKVTIDGVVTGGTVDLVANEALVEIDANRTVEILIDRQNDMTRVAAFVTDRSSPLIARAAGVLAYPVDPWWRRPATFVPDPDPQARTSFLRQLDGGFVWWRRRVGWFDVDLGQTRHRLEVTDDGRERYVSFGDATDAEEGVSPSARMIWLPQPPEEIDVLDFNTAILNPYAFNPLFSCPLPPDSGRLPIEVTAGRRRVVWHGEQPSAGRWPLPRPTLQRQAERRQNA